MAYRTLESVLHPDSHLTLPSVELPKRPIRVMVTLLESDEDKSFADSGDHAETVVSSDELFVRKGPARIRSPRLVHPEQASFFAVKVIEETKDARV